MFFNCKDFFFFPNWIKRERERETVRNRAEHSRVVQDREHVNIVRTSEVLKQTNRELKTHRASDDLTFVCQIIERVWGTVSFFLIQFNLTWVPLYGCMPRQTSSSPFSLCFFLVTYSVSFFERVISYLARQAREVRGALYL